MRLAPKILLAGITVLIAGCKLAVIVVEGGEVQSTGSGTCVAGTVCVVEVLDTNFSEQFTAVPDPGWYFKSWNPGGKFLCGESARPECALNLQEYEGNDGVEALIASAGVSYLMPVFGQTQADMITVDGRSVIVNGKKWLQPADFIYYSSYEISMVCPDRACSGTLPESTVDLTGYNWASINDVYSLFNVYEGMGRSVLQDFDYTLADKDTTGRDMNHTLYAILSDIVYRGETDVLAKVYDSTPYEAGDEERSIIYSPDEEPRGGKDAGPWFWKAVN